MQAALKNRLNLLHAAGGREVAYALRTLLVALAAVCSAPVVSAAEVVTEVAGSVAADGRLFVARPKYGGQDLGTTVSLAAEPEFSLKTENDKHKLRLRPFYRVDPIDERRTHPDLREATYRFTGEHLVLGVGVGSFTWGSLESFRPVDVINQIDFAENHDGSAKLGQPFVEVGWVTERASLKLYYLPYFRDRTFPGARGRLRFPTVIDTESPIFASNLGRFQPSAAARFSVNVGKFDIGVGLFTGLSREPRFIVELATGQAAPRYDLIHQGSLDAQWTVGGFVFKGELFARAWSPQLRAFWGGGVGVDYTFAGAFGDADLSLAAEFLWDSRPPDAAPTFFDHDAFGGARLALGDTADTAFSGGALVDVIDGALFARLGASRRIGEHWKVSLDANAFLGTSSTTQSSFGRDHFGHARLAYHF
jgi:hypothetical protein